MYDTKNRKRKLSKVFSRKVPAIFMFFVFSLISNGIFSQIVYVGGTLTSDRVWSQDTIYIIYQDLIIPKEIKLEINPGVTVKVIQSRGIYVDGVLQVGSQDTLNSDTVYFMSNSQKGNLVWRWKGIVYRNQTFQHTNFIINASIKDAENAVEINESEGIIIKNTKIFNTQQVGIKLINSRNCIIENCDIVGNYIGIELNADFLHKTSDILIKRNYLNNENHNIYFYRDAGAVMVDNTITRNIIENGNNGVWIDNAGETGIEHNTVKENIFISIGGNAGYALFTSNDSTYILNNIFWRNNIAIYLERDINSNIILQNSFYYNKSGIIINRVSYDNDIVNNTFSHQLSTDVDWSETDNNIFKHNNLFPEKNKEKLFINQTNLDFDISGNFWNNEPDTVIDKLIWDKNDNNILGKLNYKPVLDTADTVAPVAPPFLVKKQMVNGQLFVSWTPNKEKDIKEYNIYWGIFHRYSFENKIVNGNDTSAFLNTDFERHIAVTACDSLNTENGQFTGHESPYSFAVAYPYAGKDEIICKFQNAFQLNNSSLPFDYQEILWTTSGDGTFNQNDVLHPVYYRGEEDLEKGRVKLTLHVKTMEGLWLSDDLTLFIYDNPEAFAGNDTIITENDSLNIVHASASNFEHVAWQTSGDGYFDNDTVLNTVYYPGTNDLENTSVELYLFVFSKCGFTTDTLKLFISKTWQLSGKIWAENVPFSQAVLMAVKKDDTLSKKTNIIKLQPDGSFFINNMLEGEYFLYALPDTNNSGNFLPVYYKDEILWQNSYIIPLYADTYDVDIHLKKADLLPEGEGSISGKFFFSPLINNENNYFISLFSENQIFITDTSGLPNVTILLYNKTMNRIFSYKITDSNGNFVFKNLPFGDYIINAEMAGYTCNHSQVITLSPQYPDISGIILKIGNNKTVSVYYDNSNIKNNINVYPNPFNDCFFVDFNEIKTNNPVYIKVFDDNGKLIINQTFPNTNKHIIKINMLPFKNHPSGLYLIDIMCNNKSTLFKIIRN